MFAAIFLTAYALAATTEAEFRACTLEAVHGSTEKECALAQDSAPCVGLKRALENSQKRSLCLKGQGPSCPRWSHLEKTEDHWIAIASAHLGKFGQCIRSRYGNAENPGLEKAQADAALEPWLRTIDDGGKIFHMANGGLLLTALQGDRFGYVIEHSVYAKKKDFEGLHLAIEAADNPVRLTQKDEEEEEEGLRRNAFAKGPEPQVLEAKASPGTFSIHPSYLRLRELSRAPANAVASSKASSEPSLFQRVRKAYQRNAEGMRGFDDFVKAQQPAAPRDLSELLSRGGTL